MPDVNRMSAAWLISTSGSLTEMSVASRCVLQYSYAIEFCQSGRIRRVVHDCEPRLRSFCDVPDLECGESGIDRNGAPPDIPYRKQLGEKLEVIADKNQDLIFAFYTRLQQRSGANGYLRIDILRSPFPS